LRKIDALTGEVVTRLRLARLVERFFSEDIVPA